LPALFQDAGVVYANVFGYRGQILQTVAGMPVWGLQALLSSVFASPDAWLANHARPIRFFLQHGWLMAILLLLLLTWLRRRSCRSAEEVCVTLAMGYTILYGFTNHWAFQYFAWSVPLWFFLRPGFFIPATILAGGYIYSLYWFLCGNPWLFGKWDFVGHPYWPAIVTGFRNLAVLFFFVSAWVFLISAASEQITSWWRPPPDHGSGDQKSDGHLGVASAD
jgi:hypothetical protein